MMRGYETLTDPAVFDQIPMVGGYLRNTLEHRGQELLQDTQLSSQKLTIAVRTLNELHSLARLLETIKHQKALGDTQLIVVDNESSDRTAKVARAFGAEVVALARGDFTYAASMNLCMEAADHPNVLMTVGHAALASTVAVEAAKRTMEDDQTAGAFTPYLPGRSASRTENLIAIGNAIYAKPAVVKKASMGVMGATNAVFRKDVWSALGGFDEHIQNGGEDTDFARKALAAGLTIVREPLLAAHHSHGLGPINYARQVRAWMKMLNGDTSGFDAISLQKRRPDLDFS